MKSDAASTVVQWFYRREETAGLAWCGPRREADGQLTAQVWRVILVREGTPTAKIIGFITIKNIETFINGRDQQKLSTPSHDYDRSTSGPSLSSLGL